ncbi:MAG: hypothetical protein RL065_368 [Bacteroidota bacterium]
MLKRILCAALCVATLQGVAKPKSIGIQGGLNYSDLKSGINVSPGLANNFGITIQKYRNKYVFFETGMALDKNAVINKLVVDPTGQVIQNAEITATSTYISIPLIVGFKTGGKFFAYTKLGVAPSVLLSWNQELNTNVQGIQVGFFKYSPSLKISPNAEIGIGKLFGKRFAITLGTKANYQLFSLYDTKAVDSDGRFFYKSLGVNLGMHFFIKKMD